MSSRDSILHPDFVARPYWWEAAAPTAWHSSELPAQTQVLIVGAGYAGLNAALELARAGVAVCAVDAEQFGFGASSRNGGAVSAGVNLGKGLSGAPGQRDCDAGGKAVFARLLAESGQAFDHLERVIERQGIDCRYERSGRLIGAHTPAHYAAFADKMRRLNELSEAEISLLPAERQREHIGSDYYYGAMLSERSGKLHPALYYRGLLDAAAAAGATLCAETQVLKIDGAPGRFTLETSAGSCRAEQVVIATNGTTGALTPELRRRLVPVASHIIATEELPDGLGADLFPTGRTISETQRILHYYRLSPDGKRVIFGGRAKFTEAGVDVVAPILHARMVERFPELAGIRVSHAWSGLVAFTADFAPHLGLRDGLHYCLGCNGSGVAMLSYFGYVVARRIVTGGEHASAYAGRPFAKIPLPFYSGRPWFLPALGSFYLALDRHERRRAARI